MNAASDQTTRSAWLLMLSAAAILMITMGARQTSGLFLSPINTATGLGIVSISFALAVGQFVWGAVQPVFGAISDKFGAVRVLIAGGLLLAAGTALTPFVDTQWGLLLTMGILSAAGALGQRYRMKNLLALMYASRALMIVVYLLAPKTPLTFYIFAAALGFTWLATVPPTAGLVGKLFGTRYLATLFGLTLLSHQTGAFLGAWLGGIALERNGDYQWMWYADIALAAAAALVNLPIREARVVRAMATA